MTTAQSPADTRMMGIVHAAFRRDLPAPQGRLVEPRRLRRVTLPLPDNGPGQAGRSGDLPDAAPSPPGG